LIGCDRALSSPAKHVQVRYLFFSERRDRFQTIRCRQFKCDERRCGDRATKSVLPMRHLPIVARIFTATRSTMSPTALSSLMAGGLIDSQSHPLTGLRTRPGDPDNPPGPRDMTVVVGGEAARRQHECLREVLSAPVRVSLRYHGARREVSKFSTSGQATAGLAGRPRLGRPLNPGEGPPKTGGSDRPRLDFLPSDPMWGTGWDRTAIMRRAQAEAHAYSPHPLMPSLSRCCLRPAALGLGPQV
jgi:hypothetical protein